MSFTKEILLWTERKSDEIKVDDKFGTLKLFGLGAIEGALDGAVIAYPMLLIGCILAGNELKRLHEKE